MDEALRILQDILNDLKQKETKVNSQGYLETNSVIAIRIDTIEKLIGVFESVSKDIEVHDDRKTITGTFYNE